MAKPPLARETAADFLARVNRIREDTPRKFGSMDANRMLRHMRLALETAVGETDLPDSSIPVVRRVLFFAVTRVVTTWPGGKLKAPDWWSPPSEHPFEEEKRRFLAATDRFLAALEENPERVTRHPIFGPLKLRQWSRLHGIHLHHHLRQFGA